MGLGVHGAGRAGAMCPWEENGGVRRWLLREGVVGISTSIVVHHILKIQASALKVSVLLAKGVTNSIFSPDR